MTGAIVIPMRDNPDIIELLGLLDKPGFEGQKKEYMSVLDYVDALTNQYNSIMEELADLKKAKSGQSKDRPPKRIKPQQSARVALQHSSILFTVIRL